MGKEAKAATKAAAGRNAPRLLYQDIPKALDDLRAEMQVTRGKVGKEVQGAILCA